MGREGARGRAQGGAQSGAAGRQVAGAGARAGRRGAARAHRREVARGLPGQDPARRRGSFHQYERYMMLQILDSHWREHLAALDHLRQGIHLRGYAQKNPKQEYKREAFELFGAMLEAVKLEVTRTLVAVEIRASDEVPKADVDAARGKRAPAARGLRHRARGRARRRRKPQPTVRPTQKVGPQRSLPLRLGQEVQALPRQAELRRWQ